MCFKSLEAHRLLKTLMEVYGNPFTGLGPTNSLEILIESAIEYLLKCMSLKILNYSLRCFFCSLWHTDD